MRQCTKCCQAYPEWSSKYFNHKGYYKDGRRKFRSECKRCTAQENKSRKLQSREENPREFYLKAVKSINNWRKRNPQKYREYVARWRRKNPERAKQIGKKYRSTHVGVGTARSMRRYAHQKGACPSWADLSAIKALYEDARRKTEETGVKYSVDHIDPLRSEFVCGLHIHANLRVIPLSENTKKSNSFRPYQITPSPSGKGWIARYL